MPTNVKIINSTIDHDVTHERSLFCAHIKYIYEHKLYTIYHVPCIVTTTILKPKSLNQTTDNIITLNKQKEHVRMYITIDFAHAYERNRGVQPWTELEINSSETLASMSSWHLFIKRVDVLPQDLVKCRSPEIGCYSDYIALKSASLLAVPLLRACQNSERLKKSKSESRGFETDFTRSCDKTSVRLVNRGPCSLD